MLMAKEVTRAIRLENALSAAEKAKTAAQRNKGRQNRPPAGCLSATGGGQMEAKIFAELGGRRQ